MKKIKPGFEKLARKNTAYCVFQDPGFLRTVACQIRCYSTLRCQ